MMLADRLLTRSYPYLGAAHLAVNSLQIVSRTGACDTFPRVNGKQRPVGATDDVGFFPVEEAIRHPVKGRTGMGAAVLVNKNLCPLAQGENR